MAATIQRGRYRSSLESLPMTAASPGADGGSWVCVLTVLLYRLSRLMIIV
jgi:hypothetical protein